MKLHFKKYGEQGDAVIILHGIFGMLDNWHSFASQLGQDFRVFTIDHRNHGRSPHSDRFSYEDMVDDLEEFLADQQLDRVHLIGHSMGGKAGMHFALKHPDKIGQLVVLDIGIKYYPPRHDYIFQALCHLELNAFESRNDIDQYLSEFIPKFGIRQFLIKNVRRNQDGSFSWKMNLPVIRESYEALTEWIPTGQAFGGKTLFIRGANSSYILMDDWPGIREIFPNARLETIGGAGHWLHAEKPYELLKSVRAFLSPDIDQ